MRNYFPKRTSGAPLHTLSKLYDVTVGFVSPSFGAVFCYICGRRRVVFAQYRMICHVLLRQIPVVRKANILDLALLWGPMRFGLDINCTCTTRPKRQNDKTINESLQYLAAEEMRH